MKSTGRSGPRPVVSGRWTKAGLLSTPRGVYSFSMTLSTLSRRDFLAVLAVAGLSPRLRMGDDVDIVQFSSVGKREGVVRVPRIGKSDAEWRRQLSAISFE